MNDASYKRLLNHRRTIKDVVLGFIARLRPSGWADELIFDTLREYPTEHVDEDLTRRSATPSGRSDHRAADGSGGFKVPGGLRANSWGGGALVLMEAVCRAARHDVLAHLS